MNLSMIAKKATDHAAHEQPAVSSATVKPWPAQRTCLWALALLIITLVAYQPIWHAGFIWDDDDHLTANPAMTAPHGLRMIWSSLAVSRYYPLTLTCFWIQRRLWGLDPLPYHLVNVALHAANGVLVLLVLRRLRVRAAWLAAMLWTLHPVNVESVAWITELKNVQSGLFFFLSVLCFFRSEGEGGWRRWDTFALVFGLAAFVSKPSTVVLPLVLLLCVWWERGSCKRVDVLRIIPLFIAALGMSALTIIEQRGHIQRTGTAEWNLAMAQRFVLAGKAVWFYACKTVWPAELTFVYPHWNLNAGSFWGWLPLGGLAVVGLLLWLFRRQSWARASLLGSGFFVLSLLPVVGFINIYYFRFSYVADHFAYLACLGLISLVVATGAAVCERAGRWRRPLGGTVAAAVLLVLGAATWSQAHIYHDPVTLWSDTLRENPECWMAHDDLGVVLVEQGRFQEAIGHYQQALQLRPGAEVHNNMGIALARQARFQEAISHYQQALQLRPDYAEAHNNLGIALFRLGQVQEAMVHWQRALEIKPDYAEAHNNMGNALLKLGDVQKAIDQYEQALRIKPDYAQAQRNLARARAIP